VVLDRKIETGGARQKKCQGGGLLSIKKNVFLKHIFSDAVLLLRCLQIFITRFWQHVSMLPAVLQYFNN